MNGPPNGYSYGDASDRDLRGGGGGGGGYAAAAAASNAAADHSGSPNGNPNPVLNAHPHAHDHQHLHSGSVHMSDNHSHSHPHQRSFTSSMPTQYPSRHPPPPPSQSMQPVGSIPSYPIHQSNDSHALGHYNLNPHPPHQHHHHQLHNQSYYNTNGNSSSSSTSSNPHQNGFNHSHQRFNSHPPMNHNQNHNGSNNNNQDHYANDHNNNHNNNHNHKPSPTHHHLVPTPVPAPIPIPVPVPAGTRQTNQSHGMQAQIQKNDRDQVQPVGDKDQMGKGKKRQRVDEANGIGNGPSGQRKSRVNLSCLPCKQRKIKCDRNVPQCESCIKRGISHLCAFGDERDSLVPKANSPTTAALLAKISHLESQLKTIKENGTTVNNQGKSKLEDAEESEEGDEIMEDLNGGSEAQRTKFEGGSANSSNRGKLKARPSPTSGKNSSSSLPSDPDFESESVKLTEATMTNIDSDPSHWGKAIREPSAAEIKAAATAPETSDVRPVPIKGGGGRPIDETTLDNFYNLLPKRQITDYLIEHFIIYVHNSIPCLHIPTLRRHYLNVMNRKLKGNNKDLNILSLIFIIFEASCESLSPSEIFKLGLTSTRQDLASLLDSFHTLSHRLLHLSHFYSAPTLEGFQAIVITRSYWFERRAVVGYSALNVRAIRLAQSIGLHRLGNFNDDWKEWEKRKSKENEIDRQLKKEGIEEGEGDGSEIKELLPTLFFRPQENTTSNSKSNRNVNSASSLRSDADRDSSVIKLNHSSKDSRRGLEDTFGWDTPNPMLTREIGRRIWTCLCIIEYFLCGYSGALPAIMPNAPGVTTTLPVSIEDEMLDSIKYPTQRIYEKSSEEPTQLSFTTPHYRTSLCAVNSYAAMQRGDSYEGVLKCNREVLDILESLPSFYRLDGSEDTQRVINLHKERPYLNLHRSVLNDLLYYRLLVMNRMYMGVGYRNDKFKESTRLCLESAHGIIKARLDFAKMRAYPLDLWITIVHVFHAACTLQLHLLRETNVHGWTNEMTRHQQAADDADRFLKSISYQSTGGKSGGSLCEALSKLREKTVARQKQFHPETPAPPRHSSHFLNVVLLDTSHSVGGGNGLNGSGSGHGNLSPTDPKKTDGNATANRLSSSASNDKDNQYTSLINSTNSATTSGGISQRPGNPFPNENPTNLTAFPTTTLASLQGPLDGREDIGRTGNGDDNQKDQPSRDGMENELPPADCITELQPYLDSFRSVGKNESDDSFLQILEELFSDEQKR